MPKTKHKSCPNWWVYIIETAQGTLYTGVTLNLERRFWEHMSGSKKGAKYFRSYAASKIVYKKKYKNRSEAQQIESHIKKLSKAEKVTLIEKKTRLKPKRIEQY